MIRILKTTLCLFAFSCLCFSCATPVKTYSPQKKYSPAELREDYSLFRNILQTSHPSLYWYQTKERLDYYFDQVSGTLVDSMTEIQFRDQLAYVISKIDCGHTSLKGSKAFGKYIDTALSAAFPFAMKFWSDTMVITANLRRRDPYLQRGTIVQSINGYTARMLTDTLFNYITTDGYSENGKYQSLSTGFAFANLYKNIIGLTDSFDVRYIGTDGLESQAWVKPYDFRADTVNRKTLSQGPPSRGPGKKKEKPVLMLSSVNLQLDTVMKTGFMTVSTFDRNNHLHRFFKNSFRNLEKNGIKKSRY